MSTLAIEFPESILVAAGQSREEFVREGKFLLAVKLFEVGRLSSGKAAEMCGLSRAEFLLTLGRMGIPAVDLDEEELAEEFTDV